MTALHQLIYIDENVSINDSSANRKRESPNDHHSTKRSHIKQRKQVTYDQVHQNPSEVSDKTSSEISPILETYEQQLQTFQSSNTFETLGTTSTLVICSTYLLIIMNPNQ